MTDTIYFSIGSFVFICICTFIQIMYIKDRFEKLDVVLGTLVGLLASLAWPATLSVAVVVGISRFFAKIILKYFGDSNGR